MDKPDTAMLFAAGFGKRMRPLTETIPKPLVKVLDKPIIDYSVDLLEKYGVGKIVVNTHYLADQIKAHFEATKTNSEIIISHEEEILETGGGIVKALPLLGNKPFFSLNSDTIIADGEESALERLSNYWDPDKMDVLMLLHRVGDAVGYDGAGDFDLTDDGRIVQSDAHEKPYVFTGAMIIKPEIFKNEPIRPFSVYRDFIKPKYIQKDKSLKRVYGLIHDGKWYHIGTIAGVGLAENHILNKLVSI